MVEIDAPRRQVGLFVLLLIFPHSSFKDGWHWDGGLRAHRHWDSLCKCK